MISLSATKLKLFLECPRCFWLSFRGIKRPTQIFASVTYGIDLLLKDYFDKFRGQLPPILFNQVNGVLVSDEEVKKLRNNVKFQYHDVEIVGKLDDCIIDKDGNYMALDNKSSGFVRSRVDPYHQFQLDLYTLLLLRNKYKINRKAYVIYYIPIINSTFPFTVNVHEITTDPDSAFLVITNALEVINSENPPENSCDYCKLYK